LRFEDLPVDFDSQMLLIATMNQQPTTGYAIRITRVYRKGHKIHAEVRSFFPDPQQPVSASPVRPWHVVAVPKSDLNVEDFATASSVSRKRPYNPYR